MRVFLIDSIREKPNGVTTYMAELIHALRLAGHDPRWVRLTARSEGRARYGLHGERYWNLSAADARTLERYAPVFLASSDAAAPGTPVAPTMVAPGRAMMVHHPVEATPAMRDAWRRSGTRLLASRPALVAALRADGFDVSLIRLPYRPVRPAPRRTRHAVCFTRLSPEKGTPTIIRANQRLPEGRRVAIFGAAHPAYYSTLTKKYPGWVRDYEGRFGTRQHDGPRIAATARYAVDLTLRPVDGGGTQYCTLEAWDAGAVLIVEAGWVARATGDADDLEPGVDCLAVDGEDALVALLEGDGPDPEPFRAAGRRKLALHDPATCGRDLAALLGWGE